MVALAAVYIATVHLSALAIEPVKSVYTTKSTWARSCSYPWRYHSHGINFWKREKYSRRLLVDYADFLHYCPITVQLASLLYCIRIPSAAQYSSLESRYSSDSSARVVVTHALAVGHYTFFIVYLSRFYSVESVHVPWYLLRTFVFANSSNVEDRRRSTSRRVQITCTVHDNYMYDINISY